jgi:ubiquinone/menaquinone biosynthesis C-methylase UbiE
LKTPGGTYLVKLLITAHFFNFAKIMEASLISHFLKVEDSEPQVLLDVGCGSGEWSNNLATKGVQVYGIDPDKEALLAARTYATKIRSGATFIEGTAEDLPFQSANFDYILSVCAIEHFNDFSRAISEMSRVIKTRGTLVLTADSFSYGRIKPALKDKHRKEYHVVNYFTEEQLTKELNKYGFKILESSYFINSHLSSSFFVLLIRYPILSLLLFPVSYPLSWLGDRITNCSDKGYLFALRARKAT